jgi:putative ABC transport system permease protein
VIIAALAVYPSCTHEIGRHRLATDGSDRSTWATVSNERHRTARTSLRSEGWGFGSLRAHSPRLANAPSPLAPDIDNSALVGYPAAHQYLGYVSMVNGDASIGPPTTMYVRAATGHEAAVQSLLAKTANPQAPNEVNVSRPSDVLTARAAAGAFDSLFLGLGVVALIVGAVGVANIMIISVLERRSEIGLRRALGATSSHIRTQFLTESILLAVIGGIVGVLAGVAATAIHASAKDWAVVIPAEAWTGGIGAAILIGAFAGLMPALRASRMPPTVALRTV